MATIDGQAARIDKCWQLMQRKKAKSEDDKITILSPKVRQFSVSEFVGWYRDKTLKLSPKFQRRPVWKTGAKSLLIDTILKGYPIGIYILDSSSPIR